MQDNTVPIIIEKELKLFIYDELEALLIEYQERKKRTWQLVKTGTIDPEPSMWLSNANITIKNIKKELQERKKLSLVPKPKSLIDTEHCTKDVLTQFVQEIDKLDQAGNVIEKMTGAEFAKNHKELLNEKWTSMVLDAVLMYIKKNEYSITNEYTPMGEIKKTDAIIIRDSWKNFCEKNNILTEIDKQKVKEIIVRSKLANIGLIFNDSKNKKNLFETWFIHCRKAGSKQDMRMLNLPNINDDWKLTEMEFSINFSIFKSLLTEAFKEKKNINIGRGYYNVPALMTHQIDRVVNHLNKKEASIKDNRPVKKVFRYNDNFKLALQYIVNKYQIGKLNRKNDFIITYQELIEKAGLKIGQRKKERKTERIDILTDIVRILLIHLKDLPEDYYLKEYDLININRKKEEIIFSKQEKLLESPDGETILEV